MFVKCINANGYKYLTVGKVYKVIGEMEDSIYVKTDIHRVIRYPKEVFEVKNVL